MNKELAKTLTTALVQFIDKERSEGTMCCSNAECERLEKAFEANNLDFVEGFMEKKLSRLTEFEQEVSDMVEYCKENGEHVAFDYAKRHAKTLLAIAREQFKPEIDAEIEKAYKTQDVVVFRKGWEQGRADAMKGLPRWKKCAPHTIYNTIFNLVNGCGRYLMVDGYQIDIDLLLEKLPGFKED